MDRSMGRAVPGGRHGPDRGVEIELTQQVSSKCSWGNGGKESKGSRDRRGRGQAKVQPCHGTSTAKVKKPGQLAMFAGAVAHTPWQEVLEGPDGEGARDASGAVGAHDRKGMVEEVSVQGG